MEQPLEEKLAAPPIQREALHEWQQINVELQKRTATTVEVDQYGLMLHPETWSREVARLMAQGETTGDLTQDHWRVIGCLRQYYLEFEVVPPVRLLERCAGISLQQIYKLFPNGLAKGLCKVAGIPSHVAMIQGYTDKGGY